MNLRFLNNEELSTVFESAKKAAIAGERIVSANDGGLSFTKQFTGTSPETLFNIAAAEIARRKSTGELSSESFPQIPANAGIIAFPTPRRIF